MRILARAGYVARGVLYIIIGWIAVQVAFGHSGQQADKSGALQELGTNPAGEVALWLLLVGFIGMALWKLTAAIYGSPGAADAKDDSGDKKAMASRAASSVKAVIYAVLAFTVLKYAVGSGTQSSDKESTDLTATLLKYPGGQVLIVIIGIALVAGGAYLVYEAWTKKILEDLQLAQLHQGPRRAVEWLGRIGSVARGVVFGAVGVFLAVAAIEAKPQQAKGIDSALRALAATPLGPWLLVLVAIGLIMFGVFSCCQAKLLRL